MTVRCCCSGKQWTWRKPAEGVNTFLLKPPFVQTVPGVGELHDITSFDDKINIIVISCITESVRWKCVLKWHLLVDLLMNTILRLDRFLYRKGRASCLIIISLLWLCMVYPCTGLAPALPLSVSLHRGSTILMRLIGSPVKSEIAASFHHPARWSVPLGFQNITGSEASAAESLSQHTLDVDPPLSWNRATP